MHLIKRLENLVFRLPSPIVKSNTRAKILRSQGAIIGEQVSISRHSTFGNPINIEIGDDCVIGSRVFMDGWSSIIIGNHVIIGADVTILTGNHELHTPNFEGKLLPIKIEDYAWIAIKAVILQSVTIGRGAVVGAGAVVRENVPPLGITLGNPAQLVGYRRCNNFTYNPAKNLYLFH
ncbi:DapH/DapD/GlmU-related protein [Nostoc sp.]|uniref:DapH/DapD/GlmU-related protein n=1 Tax=Nostoc sp. TaxID=1180 RepID=UPI002FF73DDE